MRKLLSTMLTVAITSLFTANTFAAPLTLAYDGKVFSYTGKTYNLKVNGEMVQTDMPSVIIEDRALVPARAVFEKMGAAVNWDGANQKVLVSLNSTNVELKINDKKALVNNKAVELDVPAKIINDRTMLPARFVAEQLNMKVGWMPDAGMITIDQSILKNVTYASNGNQEAVTISLDYFKNYNIFRLSEPDRIVIDFPNTRSTDEPQKLEVNSGTVKTIRYRQFENNAARIVLDVNGQPDYRVEEKEGQLLLIMQTQVNRGGDVRVPTPAPTPAPTPTPTPTPAVTPVPTVVPTPGAVPLPLFGSSEIKYSASSNEDEIVIPMEGKKKYNIVRVTDPQRLVIDIENNPAPGKEQRIDVNSSRVKAIRYAQFGNTTARIVLDVEGMPDYTHEEKDGKLVLKVKNPTYGNITYHSNGDRVYFSLKWTKLTDTESDLKKLYSEKFDPTGKKYTITFTGYAAEFKSGTIKINDSYVDSVDVLSNTGTNETSITFNAKDKLAYEVMTRYTSYDANKKVVDTAVTLLKPAANGEKLVVIDPGHGDYEPGAIANNMIEKELNIDIAKRLNAILKSKGVKTYMMRDDDSFVDLYERAYIANRLNASLFISIHNNANNKSSKGTETFYYEPNVDGSKFNAKTFAQYAQQALVNYLGTIDRRAKSAGFVVIKYTKMPSILAEIAFMDNKEDAENLKNEEFRQRAAVALSEAIIKALGEVK